VKNMAHVSTEKKQQVQELVSLLKEYPIIGAVDMSNIPAKQMQNIRQQIREIAVLRMAKRRIIKIAFKESGKDGLEKLEPYLEGMPALIFTKSNPFKLIKMLEKNRSSAPAKAGQKAPKGIQIKAGPTSFTPGPIIGQLGKYKIKTGVDKGKITIKEDAVVAKAGDVISEDLASILQRLGVEPMEIGLALVAVFEKGSIFTSDILRIDSTEYEARIRTLAAGAFNVAIFISYPTKDTIEALVKKAYTESKGLAVSQGILSTDTVKDILAKAYRELAAVSARLPEDVQPEGLKGTAAAAPESEDPKEDEPKEEKQETAAAGLGSLFG